ncbi:hypothetical protein [Nonomuraea bangladeshensis]|uniref:hypothetical protein n=1 Tax=Nonomuraea bangladeshensis TaxID=404385 RepID=UPI003C309CD7
MARPKTLRPDAEISGWAIAAALFLSYGSVEKHVTQIFTELGLPSSDNDHRRVLAVLRYLQA